MIGNDIVDLGDPDTQPGATHPRFDARVFTATELEAIHTSPVPNRVRWLLWAAKESAFKAFRKHDPSLVFSPARLVVARCLHDESHPVATVHNDEGTSPLVIPAKAGIQAQDPRPCLDAGVRRHDGSTARCFCAHGMVCHGRWRISFGAVETEGAVHVIAQTDTDGEVVIAERAEVDAECPSVAVRRLAIAALAPRLGVDPDELTIVRDGRVPRMWLRDRLAPVDLSLSHHGRFVAFAALLCSRHSCWRGAR
ncbi:MAG: 4'-phosphopantetheinyl transferase superfamily protein [Deltaproteobacteria bacterium]|nr:4'-phosphopantetheinyl transferase superfamily protein [Deltaproteobacteria bacterium]MBI3388306.1 4'-phosphopantetheinyl transferase superfamily protein [Deltaproteobacteria bacterium]